MTRYRSILSGLALTLLSTLMARSAALQQTSTPDGVIRINVNLVQLDAVVTDGNGRPVTDLSADDFEILQDGKAQRITNFSFVNVKESKTSAAPPPAAPNRSTAPAPPPVPLRPDQIRRTIALVVDDLGLSFEGTARVREALAKWVDAEMQSGDLVAIIRSRAGMGSAQQFTSDKRVLRAAIDAVQYRLGRVGLTGTTALAAAQAGFVLDTTALDEQTDQSYTLGSIGAIQYVIRGLRDLPGRKSLIVFSERMSMSTVGGRGGIKKPSDNATPSPAKAREEGPPGRAEVLDERTRQLLDSANRSSVVIYAVDPRGPAGSGITAEDSTADRTRDQLLQAERDRAIAVADSREGMALLAEKTGGLYLHDTNDVPKALRSAVDDGDGYYLIAYQPASSTFDDKDRTARFHDIAVRVKRPGLRVRSRSGFFGLPDGSQQPAATTREAQIVRALYSPFTAGELHPRLTTLFSHADKEGPYINALFYIDARDLTFTQDAEGFRAAAFDTAAVTFDADGKQVDSAGKTWTLRLADRRYADIVSRGLVYSMRVPVKKPGAYQVRVVLRDSAAQRVGSATQFIEIPDVSKGRLALSGIVLTSENNSAELREGQIDSDDPEGTPAVRIFKPGTPIVYGYQILNASSGKGNKTDLQAEIRVFRDGVQVYQGKPSSLTFEGQRDPKHLVAGGSLQLGQTPPGSYVLQLVVADKLAKEKSRLATQSIDFEVRK